MTTMHTATGDEAGAGPDPRSRTFALRVTSTLRGARLARRAAAQQLHLWGYRQGSDVHATVTLIVGELAANAVTHGHVPGRGVLLRLTEEAAAGRLLVEVSDTRGERLPVVPEKGAVPDVEAESGRGLSLVAALADRWGVADREGGAPGKTVWATLAVGADVELRAR